jgi:hypothetical protein
LPLLLPLLLLLLLLLSPPAAADAARGTVVACAHVAERLLPRAIWLRRKLRIPASLHMRTHPEEILGCPWSLSSSSQPAVAVAAPNALANLKLMQQMWTWEFWACPSTFVSVQTQNVSESVSCAYAQRRFACTDLMLHVSPAHSFLPVLAKILPDFRRLVA